MSFLKSLRDFDRKFPWSFLGFFIAFILGMITVYDRFIVDKYPKVYFDVLTNTPILDIKEDLPNLDILFDKINIREQNLSLRIISVKVLNDSSKNILKKDYDPEDRIGLRVNPGKIIRVDLTNASNEYLAGMMSVSNPTDNIIYFKEADLEAQQFFVIKLLVLHPSNQAPKIFPIGHISGVKRILIREPYRDFGRISFWSRTFVGSWGVQLLRLICYTLITLLFMLSIMILEDLTTENLKKWKRRCVVKEFRGIADIRLNEHDEYLFTTYITRGEHIMLGMQQLMVNEETLKKGLSKCVNLQSGQNKKKPSDEIELEKGDIFSEMISPRFNLGKDLIDAGFLKLNGESPSVDPHMKNTLDRFVLFLKNKGIISRIDTTQITITGVGTFSSADLTKQEEDR